LQRLRRRQVQIVELDVADLGGSAERGPGEAVANAELRAFLHSRIRLLPLDYRVPLVLRDIEGFSNDEVAAAMGISVAAAKSRIHRARMRIRADLEDWERGRS
jgi:RNA polymerase sigma-70 factor, ECF subfamily